MKKLPTIKELMQILGCTQQSVCYSQSRVVLNRLDKPVLGYGLGYAGFVCLFTTHNGYLRAVDYSVKNYLGYMDASFNSIEVDRAIELIKTNAFFTHKAIDMPAITKAKEKQVYLRPHLGTITIKRIAPGHSWNESYKFNVYKYKNKKYRIEEVKHWNPKYGVTPEYFLDCLDKTKDTKDGEKTYNITENTIEQEVIEDLKAFVVASKI